MLIDAPQRLVEVKDEKSEILQGLRFSLVHLGPPWYELEDKAPGILARVNDTHVHVVGLQGGHYIGDRCRPGRCDLA